MSKLASGRMEVNMRYNLDNKCTSDILEDEKNLLEKIMSKYDFEILLVEKVRSAYKIYTTDGIYCLKKVSNGYDRAKKGFFVAQYIKRNEFSNIADYVLTSNKCLFIRYKKATFYLTKWINGREVSFNNLNDLLKCVELLARFHTSTEGFCPDDQIKIQRKYAKWDKIYKSCWNDIREVTKKLKSKKRKNYFDKLYLKSLNTFKSEFKLASKLIEGDEYNRVVIECEEKGYVCHDSFYYQNILVKKNDLYLIDLESCAMDLPMSDLGKLIRRVMPRRKYKWDFDSCRKIIEAYNRIKPITKDEYKVLLSIITFPHKYWKLGKKRYVKQKKWSDDKYLKKLNKLNILDQYKKEFIECFMKFYQINVDVE